MNRVVVTGLGAISSIGSDAESFWQSLRLGRCGIKAIDSFDVSMLPCRIAADIRDFRPEEHFDRRTTLRMARFTQFAVAAARQAWKMSALPDRLPNPCRGAVILGAGIGGLDVYQESQRKIHEGGLHRMPAMTIPKMIINEGAANISMEFSLRGRAHSIPTACASGTDAIGQAFDLLRCGRADVVVTGGTEAAINQFGIASFCALKALSTNYNDTPEKASRPFDTDRDGFVMGEGAGILILETLQHARHRGAKILAEVCGWGATADAFHLTAPDPNGTGASEAIALALADARAEVGEIDYINAHGTGTPTNDPIETGAIKKVFGKDAYRLKISSIKGHIGHCLGAAGGLEAIATVLALRDGFCPPTIHLDHPDPACDLDCVPNIGTAAPLRAALSISLGFGGHNSVLVFRRFEGRSYPKAGGD